MHRTDIDNLRPGDIVGKAVYDSYGRVYVAAGVSLSQFHIDTLRRKGHFAVYVRDGIADDVLPQDIVSDRVRAVTVRHINDLFTLCQAGESRHTSRDVAKSKLAVEVLWSDVETIMQEVLESDSLTGISALKSHDDYTFSHSVDVAITSILLGRKLFMTRDELRQLALGCLLHDVGKIFVPDYVLNKPGPLTPGEFELIKTHTTEGYRYLMDNGIQDYFAGHVAYQHHERQDGGGYPRGLRGANRIRRRADERFDRDRIMPLAEIAAVADVYSAISSDRPYRLAMPPEQVARTIRGMAGHHLNAEVVGCFLATIPVFPIGAPVVLEGGRYTGFRGVVVENRRDQFEAPIIRLTHDQTGHYISADSYDPAQDDDCRIVSPVQADVKAA